MSSNDFRVVVGSDPLQEAGLSVYNRWGRKGAVTLRFGRFDFDPDTGALSKDGRRVKLKPQAARVLALLVTRPRSVITREEIRRRLWGEDTFIEFDVGINSCIRQIRFALSDDATEPRFVQTIPNEGYRFITAPEPPDTKLFRNFCAPDRGA